VLAIGHASLPTISVELRLGQGVGQTELDLASSCGLSKGLGG